jgi:hypothetical protein
LKSESSVLIIAKGDYDFDRLLSLGDLQAKNWEDCVYELQFAKDMGNNVWSFTFYHYDIWIVANALS